MDWCLAKIVGYVESAARQIWAPTTPAICCRWPSRSREPFQYLRFSSATRSATSPTRTPTSRLPPLVSCPPQRPLLPIKVSTWQGSKGRMNPRVQPTRVQAMPTKNLANSLYIKEWKDCYIASSHARLRMT